MPPDKPLYQSAVNMIIKHIGNEIIINRQLIREGDNHIGLNDNQSGDVDNLFNNKCKPILD
jgi:hypothetical protein